MEILKEEKYKFLKHISIENCGIIKNNLNDPIYKFCVLYKIDNLGDFMTLYYIKRDNMDRRYSFSYFDGIYDLINLMYFKEDLPKEKELNKVIKISRKDNSTTLFAYIESDIMTIGRSENPTLKRLGFDNEEAKKILSQVLHIGREMSVIEAIKLCIDNLNSKRMTLNDENFLTKLYLLYEYYVEHKQFFEDIKVTDAKVTDLYRRMLLLERALIMAYCSSEKEASKISQNKEKAKIYVKGL